MLTRLVHVLRFLAEPDDVGTELRAFLALLAQLDGRVIYLVALARVPGAPCICEFTVHVQHARRTGALVQSVDVLCHDDNFELLLERRDGAMRRIRLGLPRLGAPLVVEREHHIGLSGPAFGARELDPGIRVPEARGVPKRGQPALRGQAGAREDGYLLTA